MNKCSSLISFSGAWETYQGLYRWGKSSHTQRIIIILHNNNTLAFNSSRRGGASWWHSHTPTSPSQNIEFIQALLWDPCLFCAHNCKWLSCDQVTGTPHTHFSPSSGSKFFFAPLLWYSLGLEAVILASDLQQSHQQSLVLSILTRYKVWFNCCPQLKGGTLPEAESNTICGHK